MGRKTNTPVGNKDLTTGLELMNLAGPEAELVLNTLPFAAQLACVLQVPWKERMDVIMQSEAARELVQALPSEEVFWMIKQRGVEDSLPVIARTTHDQFQYLIDLDCWQRDQLLPENCLSWYRMLGRCNIAKVLEWFERADESLLVAAFKQFVSIHKIEEESDISEEYEDMPPCTIDGVNFFKFTSEEARDVLFPLFKVLRNNDAARFQTLIEGIIWDLRIEAEDDALHWKQTRASENGFPFFDEALGIYQPLSSNDMQPCTATAHEDPSRSMRPRQAELQVRYALAEDRLPIFLRTALSALDALQLERFEQFLIATANKVMVADCMEVRDLEDVRRALHKTAGYISIGLEHLSAGDAVSAHTLTADQHPEILFRCGFSLINEIAARVRRHKGVIWTNTAPRFISFYGTPLADTAIGLVRGRPLFYEGLLKPGSSLYRDFECLADVEAAAKAVERLIAAEALLFKYAGLSLPELEHAYLKSGAISDPAELTMSSLLATTLIAQSLHADTRLPLLEAHELSLFAEQALEIAGPDKDKGLALFANQALAWLEADIVQGAIDQHILHMLVQDCLAPVRELLDTCTGPAPDVRYASAVLIKRI